MHKMANLELISFTFEIFLVKSIKFICLKQKPGYVIIDREGVSGFPLLLRNGTSKFVLCTPDYLKSNLQ